MMLDSVYRVLRAIILAMPALAFVGCGGGSGGGGDVAGGGIGGTGITSGTITGFGSVFVNGVEFDTGGSSFDVDDDPAATEADLGIGMVVKVTGTVNADGLTGSAESIEYDDLLDGPIAAAPVEDADMVSKTFQVFDTTVVVARNSTVYVNTDYAGLAQGDLVEISGYFDAGGTLQATRLEKQGSLVLGNSEVEIRGTVSGCPAGGCTGMLNLGTIAVSYDGTTDLSGVPGGMPGNGDYVEVKGILVTATSINATRIQLEETGFGDDVGMISIEGLVSAFNGIGDFRVAGQAVNAAGAMFDPVTLETMLADGDKVEVEGTIVGGILQAVEVEQRGGDIRIGAVAVAVNVAAGTVTLEVVSGQPDVTVNTTSRTLIEDKRDGIEPFGLADISPGDFLEIGGFIDDGGHVVADRMERDQPDDYELRGPVDVPPTGGTTASGSISILGIVIATDSDTEFGDANEAPLDGTSFYNQVNDGDLVVFEDEYPGDGIADEVEFEE